jgi:hypothetical protein
MEDTFSHWAIFSISWNQSIMQNSINEEEIRMLRSELELLMKERQSLLKVTGAAAGLIAELDSHDLPQNTVEAADLLATSINTLPEETLQDALGAVRAVIAG